jgi:translation initiation factor 3 subunit I
MIPILLQAHTRSLTKIVYNKAGDLIFSASKDSVPNVWWSHNGERMGSFHGHEGVVWSMAVTEDSNRLITGSGDNTARVWAVNGGKELGKIETATAVRAVALSQGDKYLAILTDATMGRPAMILVYELEGLKPVRAINCGLDGKTKPTVIAWADCNEFVLTGHQDGAVCHWDWKSAPVFTDALDVAVVPDSGSGNNALPLKKAMPHSDIIRDLQMSGDRSYFITAGRDNTAKLIDTATLNVLKTYKTERPVNSAAISPLRNEVVIAGGQEALHVTTTSSRAGQFEARFFHQIYENELGRVRGHFGPINALAYHPSGKGYASGAEDGYVRVHHFDPDYLDFMKDEPVFL